jgi:hypothetical protein
VTVAVAGCGQGLETAVAPLVDHGDGCFGHSAPGLPT